ncbi:zinc-binding dehydrogenase [Gloeobacter kilaueensis]|uniref:Beta-ketoacyl synthase n=1 Tax=Gloeobacter kilaueensis (strain ATCC BAA-2537 / CCAP 1431/1 / ULC 316 / JS1) TaxID=1183438 RepID=U5QKB7_GLOK1|nr:zinc-binding dehydrogenase [Gloeobacter kilaueensis]AGY58069.1 beta-ketoacyl synthase [Gloeobacter kilaueensis JS1]
MKSPPATGTPPFRLEMPEPGVLDDLVFRPAPHQPPGPGEVEIAVAAVGLNFREVLKALGLYPEGAGFLSYRDGNGKLTFDGDAAGRIVAVGEGVTDLAVGDAVVAFAPGGFASRVTLPRFLVAPKPAHLNFAEAVTIPGTFLTAYYALHHLGRIGPGESILIHAATGGCGLAALQLSQRAGARVFATAGKPEKRAYLASLGIDCVMDSRSLAFVEEVMAATAGRGVDLVLNSLAGEFLSASLNVLAPFGRFLEIGRRDIYDHTQIDLYPFRNNLSFFAIDLQQLPPERFAALFAEVMELFSSQQLQPLPYQIFSHTDVVAAFRHMRKANHIGKVVIALDLESQSP